nr:TMV resistance protein N-like [Arachis hypogaea]
MASFNVHSPAAAAPPLTNKYDVFISFNGRDTRNGFTSHLHAALCKNQIETFIDYRIEKGGEIWQELVEAIRESMVYLVIFSERYAQSKWCLRELVEIMECKNKNGDYHVIPVFYKIEPSHVRKQTGSYYSIFAEYERNLDHGLVRQWRKVLFDAANISGFECNGRRTEAEIIEGIIRMVVQKLNHKYTNELRSPFIRDQNYACIEALLKMQSREVQIIGIWGMGGIGKTTLAAAIFKEFSSKFEASCFLENVREESSNHGLNHIFKKLLSDLLEEKVHISTPKVISSAIISRLRRKKVFIVLDDVHTSELLETLLGVGHDYLGFGSKVIVTTRDKHVLQGRVIIHHIHGVKEMNFENSLKLFSLNAFNKHCPETEYLDLSMIAVAYASGIPLALKVLGSFLRSKSYHEWESALAKLKEVPNGDIQKEMGHKIVHEESIKNPGGRSRLWKSEEVRDILKNNKGTDAIETIFLDMTQNTDELCISSQAFRKMPNLRLLAFADNKAFQRKKKRTNETLDLPTNLELPNNLRYIQWDGCPLKSLTTSWPSKLVQLSMPYSNVEKLWDGEQNLPSLEVINLECSRRMKECPDLSGCPNLKLVRLTGCNSLTHVHASVFSLQKLESLHVYACNALTTLSSEYCSPSLQSIVAYDCPNLQEFSVPMIGDHSGIHLHLRSTALKKLPSSIFLLKDLQHFSFPISESLMDLPTNFAFQISLSDPVEHKYDTAITLHKVLPSPVFQSVVRVVFDNCCSLTEIPESFSLLSSLAHLNLYRCIHVRTLPQSLKCLPRLEVLNIFQSDMLELLPMLPPSLKRLRVWDCKLLKTVLSTISEPTRKDEATFLFLNCNNLDEDSYVRGSNIHDLFDVHSTEEATYKLSVEVPRDSNLVGFLFFIVVSEEQWSCIEEHTWYNVSDLLGFGCECSLETCWGEKVHTESFSLLQWHWDQFYHHLNITSDHAFLWYDEKCCKKIMEPIRGRKGKDINDEKGSTSTCNNANLTLEFFAGVVNKLDAVIQECGIRWIYQNVEEEEGPRGRKSKRSIEESYEEEGSDDDEQEESSIPPTKKFKQRKNLKKSCTLDLIYGDSCDEEKERHVAPPGSTVMLLQFLVIDMKVYV